MSKGELGNLSISRVERKKDTETPQNASKNSSKSSSRSSKNSNAKTKINYTQDSCNDTIPRSSSESEDETPTRLRSKGANTSKKSIASNTSNTVRRNLSKMSANESKIIEKSIHEKKPKEYSICAKVMMQLVLIVIVSGIAVLCAPLIIGHLEDAENLTPVITSGRGEAFKRFTRDLELIKVEFPSQNKKVWTTISAQVRKIMYGSAIQPACILMKHNQTDLKSKCLIKTIGTSIYYALNKGQLEGQVTILKAGALSEDPIDAKGELFEQINNNLKTDNVVIIEDIQDLHATTIMALHGICDEGFMGEEKLKPIVLIALSDSRPEIELKTTHNDFEEIASLIKSLWEPDLGVDKIHPLISRIGSASLKIVPDSGGSKYCSE